MQTRTPIPLHHPSLHNRYTPSHPLILTSPSIPQTQSPRSTHITTQHEQQTPIQPSTKPSTARPTTPSFALCSLLNNRHLPTRLLLLLLRLNDDVALGFPTSDPVGATCTGAGAAATSIMVPCGVMTLTYACWLGCGCWCWCCLTS